MWRLFLILSAIIGTSCTGPQTHYPRASQQEIEQETKIQKRMAFKRRIIEEKRINDISYRLLAANTELCPVTRYDSGIKMANIYAVPRQYRDAAKTILQMDHHVKIMQIAPGSAAEKTGLQVGDQVLSINDITIPHNQSYQGEIALALQRSAGEEITFIIKRNGQTQKITFKRQKICDYGITYQPTNHDINAYADGQNAIITRGIYRFTENDSELALVLAHELAHNAMQHLEKIEENTTIAGLGGLLFDLGLTALGLDTDGVFMKDATDYGKQVFSVEFEAEADYVGMYMMARAGYHTEQVANFWRRMASENNPYNITRRSTHPATTERFLAIQKTHQEIMDLKRDKCPLLPLMISAPSM